MAIMSGLPAGGPYSVRLTCGSESLLVADFFVGDLWLLAGQSNMAGCAPLEGAEPSHPLIRCLTMGRRWELARDPLHLLDESPDAVHGGVALTIRAAEQLRRRAHCGAGVAIPFARRRLAATGVPQCLIATAHGGTSMAQWDPADKSQGGKSLYGSMLLSVRMVAQPLAGVLWYQGESEALPALARVYIRRMQRLVTSVRQDLKQPRLPWLMVQIGRFIDDRWAAHRAWPDPTAWTRIREHQRCLPTIIPYCAVVPAIDLTLIDQVHIGGDAMPILAQRLATAAAVLCGPRCHRPVGIAFRSVTFHQASRLTGAYLVVRFTGVRGRLQQAGPVRGFTLINRQGKAVPAICRAELGATQVRLFLTTPACSGLHLSYGDGLDPDCRLVDATFMAVPAFGPVAINV